MGHAVKLSDDLDEHICSLRHEGEGYDSCLRRQFGLPSRKGELQPLRTYHIIDAEDGLSAFKTKADAVGETIVRAVRAGKKFRKDHYPKKEKVLKVREVPE